MSSPEQKTDESSPSTTTPDTADGSGEDDQEPVVLDNLVAKAPPFCLSLHIQYIASLAAKLESSFEGAITQHLRMSGVYWSLTALSILLEQEQVDDLMGVTRTVKTKGQDSATAAVSQQPQSTILDWVFDCFDSRTGGFGGSPGHEGHLLYTLSALQILALFDRLQDNRLDRAALLQFIRSLQQADGSFVGDTAAGEVDTRFSYCALSCLSLLQEPLDEHVNVPAAVDYLWNSCRNPLDGGFGCTAGAESHAGQVFCCVAAISIAGGWKTGEENKKAVDLLCWWLSERQVDSGGLNGRSEKQADVCYSWWILSALSILGRVAWIDSTKLASFILNCQDDEDGGISDRPNDMADVFHTFFGIAGLSLLGVLHKNTAASSFRQIDPVYALPTDVVRRLGLKAQVICPSRQHAVDERLEHYDILYLDDA